MLVSVLYFFFFKQKTAYEMRISDWSSDVCSSDLKFPFDIVNRLLTKKDIGDVIDQVYRHTGQKDTVLFADAIMALGFRHAFQAGISFGKDDMIIQESKVGKIGRAWGRERVCQNV